MSAQTWSGGCHCQKVRFEVEIDATNGITCNCSMCSKKGAILAFAPATKFKLVSGEDDLTDYQFNKHVIHHLFCRHCGVSSFARGTKPDGTAMAAINLRCLDEIEIDKLTLKAVDGKSL